MTRGRSRDLATAGCAEHVSYWALVVAATHTEDDTFQKGVRLR